MTQKVVFLDGEGVIWHRGHAMPGVDEVIEKMKKANFRPIVITNNASQSIDEYYTRFTKNGYTAFNKNDILTSAISVIQYLRKSKMDKPNRKVFVIAANGFCTQLKDAGIQVVTADDFANKDINEIELDPKVCAVVVGSGDEFSYRQLTIATRFVIENDALLISSNPDASYPYSPKVLIPGAYSLAMAIATASCRSPVVLGKPSPDVVTAAENFSSIDMSQSWMIGDRLDTDIKFAKNCGLKSILVLTGVSKREEVDDLDDADKPDFICEDLQACLETILKH